MAEEKEEKINDQETIESSCKKNITNIVHTIKPIRVFENWFGIFRFRLLNGELALPNKKIKAFCLLVISIYSIAFLSTLSLPSNMALKSTLVVSMAEIPGIVMLIQYVTFAITSTILTNPLSINTITALSKLDCMLRVEVIDDFYKKSRLQTVKYLIVLYTSDAINCIADIATTSDFEFSTILVYPLYLYQKLEILAFCKAILMIRDRLNLINEYLATFVRDQEEDDVTIFTIRDAKVETKDKRNFIGRATEGNAKIRDLATMYDLIGNLCSMVNEIFNFQILMTLVSTFVFIVIMIWVSLYYYRTPGSSSALLINIAIWCFSAVYTVAVMSFTCERLLLVRNESRVLVNKVIMNYDLPKTMRVQAKAFMELIEAWPLRVYIYDMFSVDITLMLKFISVATTYLILIIQISHFV